MKTDFLGIHHSEFDFSSFNNSAFIILNSTLIQNNFSSQFSASSAVIKFSFFK